MTPRPEAASAAEALLDGQSLQLRELQGRETEEASASHVQRIAASAAAAATALELQRFSVLCAEKERGPSALLAVQVERCSSEEQSLAVAQKERQTEGELQHQLHHQLQHASSLHSFRFDFSPLRSEPPGDEGAPPCAMNDSTQALFSQVSLSEKPPSSFDGSLGPSSTEAAAASDARRRERIEALPRELARIAADGGGAEEKPPLRHEGEKAALFGAAVEPAHSSSLAQTPQTWAEAERARGARGVFDRNSGQSAASSSLSEGATSRSSRTDSDAFFPSRIPSSREAESLDQRLSAFPERLPREPAEKGAALSACRETPSSQLQQRALTAAAATASFSVSVTSVLPSAMREETESLSARTYRAASATQCAGAFDYSRLRSDVRQVCSSFFEVPSAAASSTASSESASARAAAVTSLLHASAEQHAAASSASRTPRAPSMLSPYAASAPLRIPSASAFSNTTAPPPPPPPSLEVVVRRARDFAAAETRTATPVERRVSCRFPEGARKTTPVSVHSTPRAPPVVAAESRETLPPQQGEGSSRDGHPLREAPDGREAKRTVTRGGEGDLLLPSLLRQLESAREQQEALKRQCEEKELFWREQHAQQREAITTRETEAADLRREVFLLQRRLEEETARAEKEAQRSAQLQRMVEEQLRLLHAQEAALSERDLRAEQQRRALANAERLLERQREETAQVKSELVHHQQQFDAFLLEQTEASSSAAARICLADSAGLWKSRCGCLRCGASSPKEERERGKGASQSPPPPRSQSPLFPPEGEASPNKAEEKVFDAVCRRLAELRRKHGSLAADGSPRHEERATLSSATQQTQLAKRASSEAACSQQRQRKPSPPTLKVKQPTTKRNSETVARRKRGDSPDSARIRDDALKTGPPQQPKPQRPLCVFLSSEEEDEESQEERRLRERRRQRRREALTRETSESGGDESSTRRDFRRPSENPSSGGASLHSQPRVNKVVERKFYDTLQRLRAEYKLSRDALRLRQPQIA